MPPLPVLLVPAWLSPSLALPPGLAPLLPLPSFSAENLAEHPRHAIKAAKPRQKRRFVEWPRARLIR